MGFERMVVWKANQIPSSNDFKPQPYLEFPLMWGTEIPEESAGGLYYSVVGNWKRIESLSIPFYVKWIMKLIGCLYPKHILPKLLELFVPLDPDKTPPGAQQFCDIWYRGLPMDNRCERHTGSR